MWFARFAWFANKTDPKMKIMILSIICWVVADVAAIAIRNFEDKSDAARVPGSFIR